MKRLGTALIIGATLSLGSALAQSSWKYIGYGAAIVSGVTSAFTVVLTASAGSENSDSGESESGESESDSGQSDSGQSDSGQSDSQSNSKANIGQLNDEYLDYMKDYKLAKIEGKEFKVENISQPYVKELILKILSNEELVKKIDETVEGDSLLEKINTVLKDGFEYFTR